MQHPKVSYDCPDANLTVLTNIRYGDLSDAGELPITYGCLCGSTHELVPSFRSLRRAEAFMAAERS
jgi:hypothetical protein